MNKIMIFENEEFGKVRTLDEEGKVLFCGKDVACALGYRSAKDAISAHCKGAVKRRTHPYKRRNTGTFVHYRGRCVSPYCTFEITVSRKV